MFILKVILFHIIATDVSRTIPSAIHYRKDPLCPGIVSQWQLNNDVISYSAAHVSNKTEKPMSISGYVLPIEKTTPSGDC